MGRRQSGGGGGAAVKARPSNVVNGTTGVVANVSTGLKAPLTVTRDSGSTAITFAASGNRITASIGSTLAVGASLSAVARVVQADGAGVLIPVTLTGIAAPPTVTVAPSAVSVSINASPGTQVATISGVPAGVTPTLIPNDGRLVIAGSEGAGWKVVVGLTAAGLGAQGFTIAAAGAISASLAITFTSGWALGLGATPDYVPQWTRPATFAAGVASGAIPADAIDFATGNAGGPFADFYAWVDACNAANKPGALGQSLTITTAENSLVRKYLYRGIYGYGASNPKITWTGRTTGTASQKALLHAYLEDITIRGVEFVDWGCVLAVGQKTVPLIDTASVTFSGSIASNVLTLTAATSGGTLGVGCQIGGAIFTASINANTMTLGSSAFSGGAGSGSLAIGQQVFGPGVAPGTTITGFGTGTGGTGTYTVSPSQTVTATAMTTGIGNGGRATILSVLSGSGGVGSTYSLSATADRGAAAYSAGQIDTQPYHTSTQPLTRIADPVVGSAANLHCPRLARIATSGTFSVQAIAIKRQIETLTSMGHGTGPSNNNYYFDDAQWNSVLETVSLFTGGFYSTNGQIVDAINAGTGTHGYGALLSLAGDIFLIANTVNTRAISEMVITQTGTAATYDVKTPGVTITHCTFTDCNSVYAALLDTSELGPVEFHKNDCPGTWSGVYAQVTRWGHIRAANNEWYDCTVSRVRAQTGRSTTTKAMLPAGSSLTEWNTFFYMGTDSGVHMRYHVNGTTCLIENNYAHDVHSANNTNTVNCAVFADIRNCWQRTAQGKICRIAYNSIISVKGISATGLPGGAEDANAIYGKPRGLTIAGNYIQDTGSGWLSVGTLDGSETSGIIIKNPGPWNKPYSSAYGVSEVSEALAILGNTISDMPSGTPMIKTDEVFGPLRIEDTLFRNWTNYRGAAQVVGSITGNVLTVTAVVSGRLATGLTLRGPGIPAGVTITSPGTGTGGTGTYNVSATSDVGSITIGAGIEQTSGSTSGGIRITGGQNSVTLKRLRFERCDPGTTDPSLLINVHNVYDWLASTFLSSDFWFDNIEIANDNTAHPNGTFTVYGADTNLIRLNFGSNNPATGFVNGIKTGALQILAVNGSDSGFRMRLRHDNRAELSLGTNDVVAGRYGSVNYLASYAAGL